MAAKQYRVSAWPEVGPKLKLQYPQDFEADKDLIEFINNMNELMVRKEDFMSLNGDVSVYGWENIVNFALFDKYNFFVAFLKKRLNEANFEDLMKNKCLDDFVYVYCTMLTLLLHKNTTEDNLHLYMKAFITSIDAISDIKQEEDNGNNSTPPSEERSNPNPNNSTPQLQNTVKVKKKKKEKKSKKKKKKSRKKKDNEIKVENQSNPNDKQYTINQIIFKKEDAIANGNCLFDAILISLFDQGFNDEKINKFRKDLVEDDEKQLRAEKFREELAKELENNYLNFLPEYDIYKNITFGEENIANIEQHAEHLRKSVQGDMEYGNGLDMLLISHYFGICITINYPEYAGGFVRTVNYDRSKRPTNIYNDEGDAVGLDYPEYDSDAGCTGTTTAYLVHNGESGNSSHFDALLSLGMANV